MPTDRALQSQRLIRGRGQLVIMSQPEDPEEENTGPYDAHAEEDEL